MPSAIFVFLELEQKLAFFRCFILFTTESQRSQSVFIFHLPLRGRQIKIIHAYGNVIAFYSGLRESHHIPCRLPTPSLLLRTGSRVSRG